MKVMKYLSAIECNRGSVAPRREVYLDESFIHQHHQRKFDSIYDPNVDVGNLPIAKMKGRRLCFIAAMVGKNPLQDTNDFDKAQLIRESVFIFEGNKQNGDYHKNFNGLNFTDWFKDKFIPHLNSFNQNFLIILDNAKYHQIYDPSSNIPKFSQSKNDIQEFLKKVGIAYHKKDKKLELYAKLKEWKDKKLRYIEEIAMKSGHEVLFTPPYYSILQPIELLWVHVKRKVANDYVIGTTLEDVKERLENAFDIVKQNNGLVGRLIEHTDKVRAALEQEFEGNPMVMPEIEDDCVDWYMNDSEYLSTDSDNSYSSDEDIG